MSVEGHLFTNGNPASLESAQILRDAGIDFAEIETERDVIEDETGKHTVPLLVSPRGHFEGTPRISEFVHIVQNGAKLQ